MKPMFYLKNTLYPKTEYENKRIITENFIV